jgi:hypothetical protein
MNLNVKSENSTEKTEMTETEQLHQDFLKDFTELLEKYNARFEVEYMDDGYFSHKVPCIGFNSQYDYVSDNLVRNYSTIELPDYINPN